jgi:serine protease Do
VRPLALEAWQDQPEAACQPHAGPALRPQPDRWRGQRQDAYRTMHRMTTNPRDLSADRAGREAWPAFAAVVCLAWLISVQNPVSAQPSTSPAAPATVPTPASTSPPPAPSSGARSIYERHKDKLLQVRVLVAGSDSQASAGSAFTVGAQGLMVTNYHVISQLVHEPDRYRAEYVRTSGEKGSLAILAIDVQHDLALVQAERRSDDAPWPVVTLADDDSLRQGDKVYSLGNPLDLGFAISEGTFNGFPERSLYPHLLFTGAMNPGVSGGPALDDQGQVVGVNVAGYGRNAELTNFQVPVRFVRELLTRSAAQIAAGKSVAATELNRQMRQQLLDHQKLMFDGLAAAPWPTQTLGPYRVPVLPAKLARCWGEVSKSEVKNYRLESSRCALDSSRYISPSLHVGSLSTQHELLTSLKLGAWRFADMRSRSLRNEAARVTGQSRERTAMRCQESFVQQGTLPLRVVVCARAYRKLEGLYDINTTVVTLDSDDNGLESALHLRGVDHAMGLRESQRFVQAITKAQP